MKIQTLKKIPLPYLAKVFNVAFADYMLPFNLSTADLEAKMTSENINLEYSVGVFIEAELVGFMLIGTDISDDKIIAYNAGTGVIPEFRGQQFTQKMYDFLFAHLKEKGITTHQLEVITENERAITAYKKIGFEQRRRLSCFKGAVIPAEKTRNTLSLPLFFLKKIYWQRLEISIRLTRILRMSLNGAFRSISVLALPQMIC
jgi:ribosomal protein S18 acetylase RimI-like enzyme